MPRLTRFVPRFRAFVSAPLLAALFLSHDAVPARADLTSSPVSGWTVTHAVMLPGSPERAYDAATGDIVPWWDHTFHEKPLKLVLEPWAGGGFWEIWNAEGEGVRHAVVTWAERGKRLRFEGPLGLAGNAVVFVTTWDFAAKGDSTELACTTNVSGTVPAGVEQAVDQVWQHFLTGRLKPYVESGRDRDKKPLVRPKS